MGSIELLRSVLLPTHSPLHDLLLTLWLPLACSALEAPPSHLFAGLAPSPPPLARSSVLSALLGSTSPHSMRLFATFALPAPIVGLVPQRRCPAPGAHTQTARWKCLPELSSVSCAEKDCTVQLEQLRLAPAAQGRLAAKRGRRRARGARPTDY